MIKSSTQSLGSAGDLKPRGTGPRTPEGKRRTKYNAIQHGVFADLVLTAKPFRESVPAYKKLLNALCKAIQPINALDQALVEVLAFEFLRLSRIYKADAQIAPRMFEQVHAVLVQDNPRVFTECVDRGTEIAIVQKTLDPELLLRYGTSVTKHIHRILDHFDRK